jgi:hypothetical protein
MKQICEHTMTKNVRRQRAGKIGSSRCGKEKGLPELANRQFVVTRCRPSSLVAAASAAAQIKVPQVTPASVGSRLLLEMHRHLASDLRFRTSFTSLPLNTTTHLLQRRSAAPG